jgi:Ca2+-binding RTX toxin-like protein
MSDNARGGDDVLFGGVGRDFLFGDAGSSMFDAARGGNDVLFGGADSDLLFGDAGSSMSDAARGGDDRLDGGAGDDMLWGDASNLSDAAQGGRDTFAGLFGNDRVFDFRRGEDRLEFQAGPGMREVNDLDIVFAGGNTVITTRTGTVTLEGVLLSVESITEADIIFV